MTTELPSTIERGPFTKDDGYFGPESVTWKISTEPSAALIGLASATIQMLYPPVMHMIDQASNFREHPELRARRTGEYGLTITFGDKEAADRAGATLRRIHQKCFAVDPDSGRRYNVEEPELLMWVQNVLTWVPLRISEIYGPALTADERDRYVVEQKQAGRLVGIDPDLMPNTEAELDEYMVSMRPKLAMGYDTIWFRDMVLPKGIALTPAKSIEQLMGWGAIALFSPEHRQLFGIRWNPIREFAIVAAVKTAFAAAGSKPLDQVLPQIRETVNQVAFGSPKRRVEPGPAAAEDDAAPAGAATADRPG